MRAFAIIVILMVAITSPQWATGVPCDEQNMNDCELKAVYFLHSVNESEDGYNYFCDNLRNNSQCPLEVEEGCKKQYPEASASYTRFFKEMEIWCNRSSDDRKAWFKIAFCARMNKKEFHKCFRMKMKQKYFDNGTLDCKYWDFASCWAEQVSQHCGAESAILEAYVKGQIPKEYYELCNGCTGTVSNYWILNALILFECLVLLLHRKTDHTIIEDISHSFTKID